MIVHNTKAEAMAAINKFADMVREAQKLTGADFAAESLDDSGMEYYVYAYYRDSGRNRELKIHFQDLDI
jgi:hypothetical protein